MAEAGLAVRVVGEGPAQVVLVHGFTGSNRYWGAAYDRLAAGGRMMVPDLLGFGASPKPAIDNYHADEHATALADALDRLGVTGPLIFGAHSLGTLVALRVAALRPDLVRGIVAFGPSLFASAAEARDHLRHLGLLERLFALDTKPAAAVCKWVCDHRALAARLATLARPDLPGPIAEDGVRHVWESYEGTLRHVLLSDEHRRWVETAACPIQLVVGDRDLVVDYPFVSHLALNLDHVSLQQLPGGHDLPLTDPQACVAVMEQALEAQR